MLAGTVVALDNVSYGSFPTAKELLGLSTNLVLSFVDFIRTLGVSRCNQMAEVFGSPLDEVEHLCRKCRLNTDIEQDTIDGYIEQRRHWQREILGGDSIHRFEVNLREILARAKKRSVSYRIDAVANEVRYFLGAFLKRLTTGRGSPKAMIDYKKVDEIVAKCRLEPIRSWSEARKSSDYVRELMTEAFPHTPVALIARYLFTEDQPVPQNITYYCLRNRINRLQITHNTPIHREEQVAFARWTGYDAEKFIAEQAEKYKSWCRFR